jgi:hypothetical protein
MNNINRLMTCGAIAAFALTGCGASGGANAPSPNTVSSVSSNVLQLAAGTVNFQGTSTGLNIVTTYRQSNGDSGTLVNSPTLTLPAALPAAGPATGMFNTQLGAMGETTDACSSILFGPAANEAATTAMVPTSQASGQTAITTFGQSGGVYAIGIEPFNALGQGSCTPAAVNATGVPAQAQPYPIPVYDAATGKDANQIPAGWGGPPAFVLGGSGGDSPIGLEEPNHNCPQNISSGGTLNCYAGLSMGIDAFMGVAPVASGKYTLSIAVPANNGTTTQTATFTLPAALTTLPTIVAPAYVPDTAGGGTFAFVMPAGATEALVEVIDYGAATGASCNGAGTADTNPTVGNAATGTANGGEAIYYTLEATASGTLTLPDTIGPGGTPSVCTAAQNVTATTGATTDADQVAVQVIAVDYPLYEANPINSAGKQSPVILGAGGSSDMTISPAVCSQAGGACTDPLPLMRARKSMMHRANVRSITIKH